ncbi:MULTISPECIES: sulfotransferase domain-containing protein [Alteromonas]|uniref:sulfotransferase domain-containing protein n=1 Tax=Alteromonas TaxID=226 RepID=UPI00127956C4|nr:MULTISPECIES: sulfotransferase domain-containing protein [Alteromonas]MCG7654053.1 sulfotransferase domain-containing protein [Alteromonas sp. Cnat2-8]CAI2391498.1 Sulfotransferase domain-containing protein [Alteromonas macleodii]CAI3966907.1 Sulfotransferase domain-containing protein [Alteromonas macleodii]CAI3967297.1 Sulfotransferase domain-containing protein [Alteromonas macleodii]CAI3967305.1 Sulfotransferase domain-containing protein [Alteromonas macleodii]|tara:strand:+ start:3897 stop:5177 length:1281 start_codon:yes stop_codon:yes gene_type:complete
MNQCLVVVGMHRSGTSIFTDLTQSIGLNIGEIADYKDEENPTGYFENFDIVGINDDLFRYLGISWYSLNSKTELDLITLKETDFFNRAVEAVSLALRVSDKIVIKDPRITLLIDFWEMVFESFDNLSTAYALLYRDPQEVALSQQTRVRRNPDFFRVGNSLTLTKLVWFDYYSTFFKKAHLKSTILIKHSDLIREPEAVVKELGKFVGLQVDKNVLDKKIQNTFTRELYRSKGKIEDSKDITPIDKLFAHSINLDSVQELASLFETVSVELSYSSIYGPIRELTGQIEKIKFDNAVELTNKNDELKKKVDTLNKLLEKERIEHKGTHEALNSLSANFKSYLEQNQPLEQSSQSCNEELLKLTTELETKSKEVEDLLKTLANERELYNKTYQGLVETQQLFHQEQQEHKNSVLRLTQIIEENTKRQQ